MTKPRVDGVLLGAAAVALLLAGVVFYSLLRSDNPEERALPTLPPIAFEQLPGTDGLENITAIAAVADGTGRIFVAQKDGLVRTYAGGALLDVPFLDLRAEVKSDEPEQGFLGIAPSPDFVSNQEVFLSFTRLDGATVFMTMRVGADGALDPETARTFFVVPKETVWHHGGMLQFAPDGALFVTTGDDSRRGTSRDRQSPFGKIFRFDVNDLDAPPELVAWGLRNPWRFSVDAESGTIFIADVGQDAWEEVNTMRIDERGIDFGWDEIEGDQCYADTCSAPGSRPPAGMYPRQSRLAQHCAIVGGVLLRGLNPGLDGTFIASDFCSGWVFGLRDGADGWEWGTMLRPAQESALHITSYALTEDGEAIAATIDGALYRVVAGMP